MLVRNAILGFLAVCALTMGPAQAATVNPISHYSILERSHDSSLAKPTRKRVKSPVSFNAFRATKTKRSAGVSGSNVRPQSATRQNVRLGFLNRNVPRPPKPPRTPPNGGGGGTPGSVIKPPVVTDPPTANSVTYNWFFQCSEMFNNDGACSGSGSLITNVAIGPAKVISFTGQILGENILGLFVPDGWWRNDNQIISLTDEILNEGISGYTASWYFNIYLNLEEGDSMLFCFYGGESRLERECNRKDVNRENDYYTGYARGAFSVTRPSEAVVALPAALPLLASGLGALGFAGWWRRRKAAA